MRIANNENALSILQELKVLAESVISEKDKGFEDGQLIAEARTKKIIDALIQLSF